MCLYASAHIWNSSAMYHLCHFSALQANPRPPSEHFWKLRCRNKCTPLWREAHFEVKMYKAFSKHFWKLRCRKGARHCGAKHISNSKWSKRPHVRTTFRRSNVVSRGRRKGLRTWSKISKCEGFVAASTTITTLHYTPLHSITRHYSITRHHTTLPYITLHYTHYTTLITPQMQLQLHYTNYATPQLQLHYTTATTTAAPHHTTSSSCGWGDRPGDHCNRCNHSK